MQTLTIRAVVAFKPKSSHARVKWDICDSRKTEVSPQGLRVRRSLGRARWEEPECRATPWCIWKTVAQSVSVSGRGQQKRLPGDLCRAWCSPGSSALGRRRSLSTFSKTAKAPRRAAAARIRTGRRAGVRPRLAGPTGPGSRAERACEQVGVIVNDMAATNIDGALIESVRRENVDQPPALVQAWPCHSHTFT